MTGAWSEGRSQPRGVSNTVHAVRRGASAAVMSA